MLFVKETTCSLDEIFHSRFQLLFRSTFPLSHFKRETDEEHRWLLLLQQHEHVSALSWLIKEDLVQGHSSATEMLI